MPKGEDASFASDQKAIISIVKSANTLSLATLNDQQYPEVSLVPFLYYENRFYIFVSELSPHTQYLLKHSTCSLLVYNNEKEAKNHFAIERLSVSCQAKREQKNKELVLDLMAQKLGQTVSLLRQLSDFHLFALTPDSGRLITGFGKAFDVDFSDLSITHVNPNQ
ncbi:MAG: HugZ family protein [Cellvibrionaceae bacterium]